jgi:orotidine-5'-phosphate decarboxylase
MQTENTDPRIIIALDFPDADTALSFVKPLDPALCRLKVGFELFVAAGPALVEALQARGFQVFLDLKFHDIPNTVAGACRAAAALGVWMINVHAGGGQRMMEAAREALEGSVDRPLLIAVTVLTSMDDAELGACGVGRGVDAQARFLARLTQESGLDGVVCSAREAAALREDLGAAFLKVTPGIRPRGSEAGDQRRIVTPADALRDGATHLVIGRPITRAQDPATVLADIHGELAAVMEA